MSLPSDAYRTYRVTAWIQFVRWLTRGFYRVMGGTRIIHPERIPKTGPVLITANHMSYMDPPLLGCALPRTIAIMAKEELFKGLLGRILISLGAFPVKRGASDMAAIKHAVATLKNGYALVVFPEGTRGDGVTMGPMQSGVQMLAKMSGAVIVPLGIHGTQYMLPRTGKKLRRHRQIMVVGEPFRLEDLPGGGKDKSAFGREVALRIQAACREAGLELALPVAPALESTPKSEPDPGVSAAPQNTE